MNKCKNLKIYTCVFEGIDKCGKSSMAKYFPTISKHVLNSMDRGTITRLVWNKIQNTDITYDLQYEKENFLYVLLNVEKEDWKTRCIIFNEPPMPLSYEEMSERYKEVFQQFKKDGFHCLEFNTSKMSQYQIAMEIINYLKEVNK